MKTFYRAKKSDSFKDGDWLPGFVLKYWMKGTESDFYLFDEEDQVTKEDRREIAVVFIKR